MKEKLIELLAESEYMSFEKKADHLIANGVVIQPECQACAKATNEVIANLQKRIATDNNVGDKKLRFLLRENGDIIPLTNCPQWIPVTERLPKVYLQVLVCDVRENYIGIWEYMGNEMWCGEEITWSTEDITHWMPLPEPPKGE